MTGWLNQIADGPLTDSRRCSSNGTAGACLVHGPDAVFGSHFRPRSSTKGPRPLVEDAEGRRSRRAAQPRQVKRRPPRGGHDSVVANDVVPTWRLALTTGI